MSEQNRIRRERGSDTRILNTPISPATYDFLKAEALRQRRSMGVILDDMTQIFARKRTKAAEMARDEGVST